MDLFLFQQSPLAFASVAFLFGLCVGSFLNVVIHRMPKMLERDWRAQCLEYLGQEDGAQPVTARYNLVVPRSACPACGHRITALENIPVLSWVVLRGKCRACAAPISIRYPVVELLTGALTAFIAWRLGWGAQAMWAMVLGPGRADLHRC
jgi:leader peptidase (prepilin peptidase) / N-methyltransferase